MIYDAIVIGSGFGGAVTAYRLGEAGMKVLVLERGRRWEPRNYPRNIDDSWIFNPENPQKHNGWLDFRIYPNMMIAQGAGVGGGSLIYANVSVEAKPWLFENGWPPEITYNELKPYYDEVGSMLNVQTLPQNQLTKRYELMKEAAEKTGNQKRFQDLPLAVSFSPNWSYDKKKILFTIKAEELTSLDQGIIPNFLKQAFRDNSIVLEDEHTLIETKTPNESWFISYKDDHEYFILKKQAELEVFLTSRNKEFSETYVNKQGVEQGTCIHCGNCDIGCPVKAKNTLDLNYLPAAEATGNVEIRPLHLVKNIQVENGAYRVSFDIFDNEKRTTKQGSEVATRVIIAAGSLNSTELLLRCRDEYKTLKNISSFLGKNWSSNGDFLTPAFYKRSISPTKGPTITCAIDFLDKDAKEQFFIEDGGFPDILKNYINAKLKSGVTNSKYLLLLKEFHRYTSHNMDGIMPWFAQGIDAANGTLYLGRKWYMPWQRQLKMDWDIARSKPVIDAIIEKHKLFAKETGAENTLVPPTYTLFQDLVTPHPLGGCNMGTNIKDGVVNHKGEVFGYKNLYVADGSIIPEAIGLNPSRTIAALAERISHFILQEHLS